MKALIAAEVLKLRTTRTGGWFLIGIVALVTISIAAPAALVGQKQDSHTVIEGAASIALTVMLLLGIEMAAGDAQQGGLVNSLLGAPRRAALLAAKIAAAGLVGGLFAVLTALLSLGIEALHPARTHAVTTSESLWTAVGILIAGPLFAALGIGVGILLRTPSLAIAASLIWLYVIEQMIGQISYPLYLWLPGGAREALLRHVSQTHHIPPMWVGGLLLAAYTLSVWIGATLVLRKRDLT